MAAFLVHLSVRVIGATVAILIASSSLMAVNGAFPAASAANKATESSEQVAARHFAEKELDHARAALADFEGTLAFGQNHLDASAGRTLDDAARAELSASLDQQSIVDEIAGDIEALDDALDPLNLRADQLWRIDGRVSAQADPALALRDSARSLPTLTAAINAAVADVSEATRVWQVEQDRIAAERAAAQAAAERAATQAAKRGQRPANVAGPVTYRVNVRASATSASAADDAAVQAAIDAGGQVAVHYLREGVTIIAAHNTNDATALSLRVGDIVVFSGAVSGTWVVTGSMDASAGASVSSVLGLGSGLMMQTCYFGSGALRVVALAPQ